MDVLPFGQLDKGTYQGILVWNSEGKSACVGSVLGKCSVLFKIRVVLRSTLHLEHVAQLRRYQRVPRLIRRDHSGTILLLYTLLTLQLQFI